MPVAYNYTVIYFKDFNLEIDFHTFKLQGVYLKNSIFPNSMYNENKNKNNLE